MSLLERGMVSRPRQPFSCCRQKLSSFGQFSSDDGWFLATLQVKLMQECEELGPVHDDTIALQAS